MLSAWKGRTGFLRRPPGEALQSGTTGPSTTGLLLEALEETLFLPLVELKPICTSKECCFPGWITVCLPGQMSPSVTLGSSPNQIFLPGKQEIGHH